MTAEAAARIGWIDSARGIAIISVALFHAALSLRSADINGPWVPVVLILETLMLPLFFFVSGLVSGGLLKQPSSAVWVNRILPFLYLYAIWALLHSVYTAVIGGNLTADKLRPLIRIFIVPDDSIWFLYAVALYAAFVWALRNAPQWFPIAISALVSILFYSGFVETLVGHVPTSWMKTASLLVFFVLGIYGRKIVFEVCRRVSFATLVGVLLAYGLLAALWWQAPIRDVEVTRALISAAGVVAGISGGVLLARLRGFRWVEYLGRNTLPIYVLHFAAISTATRILKEILDGSSRAQDLALPPIAAALAILFSLAINLILRKVPGALSAPWLHRR